MAFDGYFVIVKVTQDNDRYSVPETSCTIVNIPFSLLVTGLPTSRFLALKEIHLNQSLLFNPLPFAYLKLFYFHANAHRHTDYV